LQKGVLAVEYTPGKIMPIRIEDEMKKSYIDYAMSVIVSRALPDVRDGFKPVHRRILYTMLETGLAPDKPHKKSARIVGDVMGRYHPHGDMPVYDALVRLAQDFSTRYPLVDGHGNFGSIDGDSPAAMRYTEVRLTPLATEMLSDINKDTVDFAPNYDDTLKEPVVLPARFPNLLVNGSSGIAVGMATNIPPHNLGEVIDGIVKMIDNPAVTSKELMLSIKGPDFPTGGLIMGREGIKKAYETGRGIIRMRARTIIETTESDRARIVVTEIPYQVNKAKLIEKIAELVREKKLEGIADLRDETDRTGLRVVLDLKKGTNPRVVLNKLFKYTQMDHTFGIIMLALVNGRPQVLSLRQVLSHYLEHQKEVITRRTRFDLRKAEDRAHILEGLKVALDHIDEVVELIRSSKNVDQARQGLMERFKLTEKQAQAILDMRLQRLTALEREKVDEEYARLQKDIEYYRAVLASERMVLEIIKKELLTIKEKYADARRTTIARDALALEEEDLIAEEDVVITVTHQGYTKRLPLATYRMQKRGGRGITGLHTREGDFVEHFFTTTTHRELLFFTTRGKVYRLKGYEIPEATRLARGTAIVNLVPLGPHEEISAVIPVADFDHDYYLFMATRKGIVKKTSLAEFKTSRSSGLIALGLADGDELIRVHLTDGNQEIVLATRQGQAIRFHEREVRGMGRTARGVIGVRLEGEDRVVGMDVVQPGAHLLVATERGFGKRTPLQEFRVQSRGGKGLKAISLTARNGLVSSVKVVREGDEVMCISAHGVIIRVSVDDVSVQGRYSQGVTLMRLEEGDRLVGMARVVAREEE